MTTANNDDAPTPIRAWIAGGDTQRVLAWIDAEPRRLRVYLPNPNPDANATPGGSPDDAELWLPIHFAAATGQTELVAAFLDRGQPADTRTRYHNPFHARQTALHLAALGGHTPCVEKLIAAGAELDALDARFETPLHLAARHYHAAVVAQLGEAGAETHRIDGGGRTALHLALTPPTEPTSQTRHAMAETVDALLAAGADPNATCPREPSAFTPLLRCEKLIASCSNDDKPLITRIKERLLEYGADPAVARPATQLPSHPAI